MDSRLQLSSDPPIEFGRPLGRNDCGLFHSKSLRERQIRFIVRSMAPHPPADIRNFAIVGHASSGKTILSEAMLLYSGAIGRMGRIAEGSTVYDYNVSERQRQIYTKTSLLHTIWKDKKIKIWVTSGNLNFRAVVL